MMRAPWISYCFALFLIFCCYPTISQPPFDYPTANLSTTWTNTESLSNSVNFSDGSRVRAILLRGSSGPNFACGFYCNGTCSSYLFAVFIVQTNSTRGIVLHDSGFPQVVWSANRDYPVSYGAVLNLTPTGELVLQDVNGSTVWSTNTAGKSVAGLNLTDDGNLVLFDINRSVVWQSFDYPTDCMVPGQRLYQGLKLIPSVSLTNWTAQKGLFSLQVKDNGLFAYVGSSPPQAYYRKLVSGNDTNKGRRYVRFLNGSLSLFILSVESSDPDEVITVPPALSTQYMKLMPNGHLKVFEWQERWLVVADLFNTNLGECNYPMACGRNGICYDNQQCSCTIESSLGIDYFEPVNDRQLNQGCSEINPLTCNAVHDFIQVMNVTYFNIIANREKVDIETCKQACLHNCSCKAAIQIIQVGTVIYLLISSQ
ncbi:putative non-specific serine/threonine protein kinase [Helianthus debilis subsp. tardiflorus]